MAAWLSDGRRRAARPKVTLAGLVVLVLLCGVYLFALGWSSVVWFRGGRLDDVVGPFMLMYALVGTGFGARVACRRDMTIRTRAGWRWITASFAMLVLACAAFSQTSQQAFPTVGDWIRLLFAPFMLIGLQRLLPPPSTSRARRKLALDNAMMTASGAMLLWYLVSGPALAVRGAPVAVMAAATAYPILDLALVFGATQVVFRPGPNSRRRQPLLIAVGVVALVIGDVLLLRQHLSAPGQGYNGLEFGCWLTGHFLFAVAAVDQDRSAPTPETAAPTQAARTAPWLPYAAVGGGYLLLFLVVVRELPWFPYGGLVVGAVVMTALVEARQILASQENHLLATTDSLTGLANRSLLRQSLTRALGQAGRRSERVAVLLIDIDDFKSFNDTLGHEAGDEILVGFARLLQRNVRPTDLVARIGGDEFVVVLTSNDPLGAAPVVARRIAEATQQRVVVGGRAMNVRGSIGIAASDPTSCDAAELLDRADAAMYRAKRAVREG